MNLKGEAGDEEQNKRERQYKNEPVVQKQMLSQQRSPFVAWGSD